MVMMMVMLLAQMVVGVVVAHAPALGQEPAGGTCRGGLPGLPAQVAALSSREEALAGRPTLVARQTSAGTVGTSPDTAPAWTAARTTLWGGTAAPLLAARRLSRRWAAATAPATTAGAASARSGAAGRRRWPALVRRRCGRPSFEGEGEGCAALRSNFLVPTTCTNASSTPSTPPPSSPPSFPPPSSSTPTT